MRNSPFISQIGIVQYEPAWETILRQIGIPFSVIDTNISLLQNYSMIIVNSDPVGVLETKLDEFVRSGGAALITTKASKTISAQTHSEKFISSLPPAQNENYRYDGILDLFSKTFFFRNNDLVYRESFGDGWKGYLGFDIGIILSIGSKRKSFFSETGRMPNEVAAKRSKGVIRQLIFSVLLSLHKLQDIPFIHQWYFPDSESTIFTMRIDSDKGSQDQIEQIYQLSEEHSIPTTWFLDVKSHESWLPYFKKFKQQEIGVHCYEHVMYTSPVLNKENFERALSRLQKNGHSPVGITAQTGEWNKSYAEVIESLGFQYSSEFSYDYDDLPSFPFHDQNFSPVLQLPVHPICIGTMLRARMDENEMIRYYTAFIDGNILLNEPICLYHHPTHEHNGVFEEVFRYINQRKIKKLSYSQYANWWKQRNSNLGTVRVTDDSIEPSPTRTDVHYRVIMPDGSECITAVNEKLVLNRLPFQHVDRQLKIDADIMRSRSFDPRHILQNGLDWWIKITE